MAHRPWTGAEIVKLKRLWSSGVYVDQIAADLGRSRNAIYLRATTLGLRREPVRAEPDPARAEEARFVVTLPRSQYDRVKYVATLRNSTVAEFVRDLVTLRLLPKEKLVKR